MSVIRSKRRRIARGTSPVATASSHRLCSAARSAKPGSPATRVGVDGQPGFSLVGRVWTQDVVEVQILVHEAVAGFWEHLLERGNAGSDEAGLQWIADQRQGAWCTVE